MPTRTAGSTLLALSLLQGCQSQSKVTDAVAEGVLESIASPKPYGPTHRLQDGVVEIHVAPQIGRVMHFSRVKEPNLFWTFPSDEPLNIGSFINYGGDKLWPWSQDAWGWPPPAAIDCGPYQQKPEPIGGSVQQTRLEGPVDPDTGLQGQRVSILQRDASGPTGIVHNTYTLTRKAPPTSVKAASQIAAWSIVQVPPVQDVYVRLMPNPPAIPTTQMSKRLVTTQPAGKNWVKINPNFTGAKIGLAGDAVAARIGDRVFLIQRIADNDSPKLEKQVAAQIYFHSGDKGVPTAQTYVELELIGPTKELEVGQSATLQTSWQILTLDEFDAMRK